MLDWLKTILGDAYMEDVDSKDLFSDKNEITAKLNNSKKAIVAFILLKW